MTRIGRYEVTGELGRGGAGVVLSGRDPETGQAVAIKQLRASSVAAARRVLREAEALRRLAHPGIVPLLEAGEAQGAQFLVLPLVPGESLGRRLERGPLPEREAAGIALQLARALAHAHAHGVLHRDVKPDNVLLRPDGAAVLVDFGLTAAVALDDRSRLSVTGQLIGTPGYWSPEQATGDLARIGPAADVYGVGATLYAALTGGPPFVVEGLADLGRLLHEDPAPPSRRVRVDPALEALVLRALARDPARRPAGAEALADELQAWLDRPTSPRSSGRRPGWPALALGLALALGGLGAALALARGAPRATDAPQQPQPRPQPQPQPQPQPPPLPPTPPRERDRSPDPRPEAPLDDRVREARRAVDTGDLDRAEALLAEARPDDVAALFQRSRLRYRRDDLAGALADMKVVVARAPDVPRYLTSMAANLALLGDLDGAWAAATRALVLDPGFVEAWRNRAHIALTRGDPVGAARDATVALGLNPALVSMWCERSEARLLLGDLEGARADAARALALDPDAWHGHERLAAALLKLRRWPEALAEAEAAVARRTNGPGLRVRGLARLATGAIEAARADLQAYLAAPDGGPDAEVLLSLGGCHGALGATEEAAAAFEAALRLAPENVRALGGLAKARLELNDVARAEACALEAVRLDPRNPAARLVLARLARLRGDLPGALATVDALLADVPADADARIERARLRATAGDVAGARADLAVAEAACRSRADHEIVEAVRASLPPDPE